MCRHSAADIEGGGGMDVTQGREVLPTNVRPTHYRLTLEPNLETFEYKGSVEIEYVQCMMMVIVMVMGAFFGVIQRETTSNPTSKQCKD